MPIGPNGERRPANPRPPRQRCGLVCVRKCDKSNLRQFLMGLNNVQRRAPLNRCTVYRLCERKRVLQRRVDRLCKGRTP